jgi:hypothetical protein
MTSARTIDDATQLQRKANLVGADVADTSVLLDIDSGYFFQLNRTGAAIWSLVSEPRSLGAICDRMAGDFRVDPETCRADVVEFVGDLLERGVLEVRPA